MHVNLTKLRVMRAERNWTQGELSRRARISQNTYSNIERGLQFPRYESLIRIANALGCSVKDLVVDE